jgi:hypothetical protein
MIMFRRFPSGTFMIGAAAAALALSAPLAPPAKAADTECQLRGRNGPVAVILCPKGQNQEVWQQAGVKACGTNYPCGAWIWESNEEIPTTVPALPTDFTPTQIRNAVAVWVAEKGQLITISKVKP